MALHRAWQTAAERLYREFQWPSARRVAERDAVQLARPCPSGPAEWRLDYNTIRPHSSLAIGRQPTTPSSAPRHRNGTGRCEQLGAPRPAPLPHRAEQAQMTNRLYSSLDDKRGSDHSAQFSIACRERIAEAFPAAVRGHAAARVLSLRRRTGDEQ